MAEAGLLRRRPPAHVILGAIFGTRLRILMYHSIADNPRDPHAVAPARFRAAMARLARGYRVVGLEEALGRLAAGRGLRRLVVLTFDDAYRDFLTTALPILRDHGLPATLFVPTAHAGGRAAWDSYDTRKPLLGWDELRAVEAAGVTIASHTHSHPCLPALAEEAVRQELGESWRLLAEHLARPFRALAYPGGAYGPRERALARAAGYRCAVGTRSHWGNGRESDPFALRREGPL